MEEEIWKDIPGYEGKYQVSNLGNVKSLNYNRTGLEKNLIPNRLKLGYLQVTVSIKGIIKRYSVHRLVALVFIPNPENKPHVNHIDGNKQNNNILNLEWCTQSENELHKFNILGYKALSGLKHYNTGIFGEDNHSSKKVYQYNLQFEKIKLWGGISEAGRKLNISYQNISKCCKGERKTAGGFIWKFY